MDMHRDVVSWLLIPNLALRTILFTLMLPFGSVVLAQSPPEAAAAVAEDQRLLPYAHPGQLVDIGGRHINLHCAGSGGPTVVLMAGIASWSAVWYKTQPVIARKTRVCAFDRAAYGFSDPAPRPQVLSDAVDDLHAALKAGGIPAPYVLVGHSLGGIEARVYTQRWPEEIVGMVLVDTSPAGEGLIDENQPGFGVFGRERLASGLLHCALLAAHGPLDPSKPEDKDCLYTLPSGTPGEFRKVWPQFFTADYFAEKLSLFSSIYVHSYDSVDHRRLGAMPLVVLSAETSWSNSTPAEARVTRSYEKVWIAMHAALAHLSTRGVHRVVKGSGHEIQLEKPQAVIDAVDQVLRELQPGAKS
jgi:pimeloyl-ACP methyl ester carboxylesterase